uniref:F-box domain-containing protein n=1 Tax=Meloidogyne incognita TaxID=6306 RepID=A0A914M3P3_MELIC
MFPYGVYCNILKHLPYETLYGSIRFVNHEFSLIASKILEQNERAWIVFFIDYKDGQHIGQWSSKHGGCLCSATKRSLPECDPPSFIRIQRLIISGRITEELVLFLNRIKKAIIGCRIEFGKVDDFMLELKSLNISLNDFFNRLPEKCYEIKLDKINSSNSDLLFSKYVLNCGDLYIQNFKDSDYKPLIKWLFGEPKIAKSIKLLGWPNVCNFLDDIKKRAVEDSNFDANFKVYFSSYGNASLNLNEFSVENKLKIHYFTEDNFDYFVFYTDNSDIGKGKKEVPQTRKGFYDYSDMFREATAGRCVMGNTSVVY